MNELLGADTPKNWGKWGPDDELGSLNYLDAKEVLRGAQHIRTGDVFTLQIQMGRTEAPATRCGPGASPMAKTMVLDESSWDGEGAPQFPGGLHYADDTAEIFLQGSTQYDALGHVWYDGQALERLRRPHHRRRRWTRHRCCRSRRRASSGAAY